jgi:hypothetical protein
MKAERVKTPETTEEVSSPPGEKGHWSQKNIETPPVPEEKRGRTGKKIRNSCGEGRESRKRPTLVVGKKSNGKSQIKNIDPKVLEKSGKELY